MTITIQLPDDLASQLGDSGRDLRRAALEAFAIEEYRSHRLTHAQVGRLLGMSRWDLDAFLKEHEAWLDYTVDDFRQEGERLRKLKEQPSED